MMTTTQREALETIVANAREGFTKITADLTRDERRHRLATFVGENSASGIRRPTARALVKAGLAVYVGRNAAAIMPTARAL